MRILLLFLVITTIIACERQQKPVNDWNIVLKTNENGAVLKGSKENLINAIRSGLDLKIGWGGKSKTIAIEHLSAPIWLAILNEKEVMAHLDPQVLSTIDWDSLNANYKDLEKLQQEWRVVLTTKGDFDAVWYDRKTDTLIRRWPQKHPMTWFAKGASPTDTVALPLFQ